MTKTRVYIVFREDSKLSNSNSGNEFIGVFFDRAQAEEWIKWTSKPSQYFIESYEQPEEGMAHEVFG